MAPTTAPIALATMPGEERVDAHRYGPYGGQYVPETLMPALAELEAAWIAARDDPGYRAELDGAAARLLRAPDAAVPRRAPVRDRRARALAQARGPHAHGVAQAQQRARPGAARQADGQAADDRRDGRGPARRRERHRRALLDLECIVYMGSEDTRRQPPNVERMRLLGATVVPVEAGSTTLKEATSEAIRDWVTNVASTHYIIGSAVGPAPYPALVRDLQRVIGDEARARAARAHGAAAGPRHRVRRRRLQLDGHVRRRSSTIRTCGSSASRRRARGSTRDATARRSPWAAGPACCTARCRPSCRTRTGRSPRRTRSRPASTTQAPGPSTRGCATRAARPTSP